MAISKTARSAVIAASLAALVGTTMTTSAEARWRGRHYGGGALALGIGSLIVGGILASQHRRHYRYRYYDDTYYAPTYGYYSYGYAPRYYIRHHRHHRHWR
jgi:hypothetical protein